MLSLRLLLGRGAQSERCCLEVMSSVRLTRPGSTILCLRRAASSPIAVTLPSAARTLHTSPWALSSDGFSSVGQRDGTAFGQRSRQTALHSSSESSLPQHNRTPVEVPGAASASGISKPDAASPATAAPSAPPSHPRPEGSSPQPPASAFEHLASLALAVLAIIEKLETLVMAAQLAFYLALAGAVAFIAWKLYRKQAELEAWWQAKKDAWAARKARFWKPLEDAGDAASRAAADARAAMEQGAEAAKQRASSAWCAVEERASAARAGIEERAAAARKAVSLGSESESASETAQEAASGMSEKWSAAVARVKSLRGSADSNSDSAATSAASSTAGDAESAQEPEASRSAPLAGEPAPPSLPQAQAQATPSPTPALADSPLAARLRRLVPSRSSSSNSGSSIA